MSSSQSHAATPVPFERRRQQCRREVSDEMGDGARSTGEDRALLQRLLPDRWEVEQCVLDTSDGSVSAAWKLRLEHTDGATIYCRPTDSRDQLAGPDVYNSHRITRIDDDGSRTVIVEPNERVFKRTAVFGVVLAAARQFSERYSLFHGT
jgi:hypothetical protein